MGLILRYATAPSELESGTVYDCEKISFSPPTLLVNITNQVYEYQYKREISRHNVNAHQGNVMLQKVKLVFLQIGLTTSVEEEKLKMISLRHC